MQGGIPAFFKGVWSPALGNIPINALVFATNGLFKKYFENENTKIKLTDNQKLFCAGSLGGFTSLIAFVPSELIKIRIQDNHVQISEQPQRGILRESVYKTVVKEIYRADGIRGFYRGFWPHFWRDVPTFGAYFLSYDIY